MRVTAGAAEVRPSWARKLAAVGVDAVEVDIGNAHRLQVAQLVDGLEMLRGLLLIASWRGSRMDLGRLRSPVYNPAVVHRRRRAILVESLKTRPGTLVAVALG